VNVIEDVSGKNPCNNLSIPVCADVIVHPPSTGIVIAPECADVGTPKCANVVLTVASSSLRPPNPGEGILASQPLEVPFWGIQLGPLGSIIARGPILVVEGPSLLLHLHDYIQLECQGSQ